MTAEMESKSTKVNTKLLAFLSDLQKRSSHRGTKHEKKRGEKEERKRKTTSTSPTVEPLHGDAEPSAKGGEPPTKKAAPSATFIIPPDQPQPTTPKRVNEVVDLAGFGSDIELSPGDYDISTRLANDSVATPPSDLGAHTPASPEHDPSLQRMKDDLAMMMMEHKMQAREMRILADRLNFVETDNRYYRDKIDALSNEVCASKDRAVLMEKEIVRLGQEVARLKEREARKEAEPSINRGTANVEDPSNHPTVQAYQMDIARIQQLVYEANVLTINLFNVHLKIADELLYAGKEK